MKTFLIEDTKQIEEIITSCSVCFVGLIDLEGKPYVIPMNFAYQDKVIYLHSAPDTQLVQFVENSPHVCITFSLGNKLVHQHPKVACSYRMKSKSVICRGKVEFIHESQDKVKVLDLIMQKYVPDKSFTYSKPAVNNVKIWKVPISQWTAKEFGAPHKGPKVITPQ